MQLRIDLESLAELVRHAPPEFGVLSIDVYGNDYWFLNTLLPRLQPAITAVEYNAWLGLRPLTVPYDPAFDQFEKHPSGLYHSA